AKGACLSLIYFSTVSLANSAGFIIFSIFITVLVHFYLFWGGMFPKEPPQGALAPEDSDEGNIRPFKLIG
ncbi:MAG TPA: hypothetical protein DDX14_02290, partial [Cyanobacteria bacterium UBA9579]|nr:hypothetical protein [Cyanobacteria bacterium UBA9579]